MKVEAKLSRRTKGLIKGKEKSIVGSVVREQCTLTPKRLCSMAQWKLKTKNRTSESKSWKDRPPHKIPLQNRQLLPPHPERGLCWSFSTDGDQKQLHCLPYSANRDAH